MQSSSRALWQSFNLAIVLSGNRAIRQSCNPAIVQSGNRALRQSCNLATSQPGLPGQPTMPPGVPDRPSKRASQACQASQPGRDTSATPRPMLGPKTLIFHWFFKQKWSKAPASMGAGCSTEPLKKPPGPQSDKLFGEKMKKQSKSKTTHDMVSVPAKTFQVATKLRLVCFLSQFRSRKPQNIFHWFSCSI